MGIIHTEKLTGPSVWKGPDFKDDDSWIRPLTPAQGDELEAAVAAVQSAGKSFPDFTIEDFPLPAFGAAPCLGRRAGERPGVHSCARRADRAI